MWVPPCLLKRLAHLTILPFPFFDTFPSPFSTWGNSFSLMQSLGLNLFYLFLMIFFHFLIPKLLYFHPFQELRQAFL